MIFAGTGALFNFISTIGLFFLFIVYLAYCYLYPIGRFVIKDFKLLVEQSDCLRVY